MPVLQPATWRGSLVPSGSAPYLLDDDLFDGSMPLLVRGAGNRNFAGLRSWSTLENNFLLPSGVGPLGRLLARPEYFMTSLASHPSGQFASVRGLFLPINLENLSFVDNTLLGSSSALNLQAPIAGIPIGGSSTLALGDGTLLRVENSCQGTTECASLLPTMRFFLNDRFGARCPQLSIVPETLSATTAFAFFLFHHRVFSVSAQAQGSCERVCCLQRWCSPDLCPSHSQPQCLQWHAHVAPGFSLSCQQQ
eukprot:m.251887 g.251887  ORF g.251887 m.251887 type:complete len:251 (+) comp98365_c0_seq1:2-754(+)